MARFEVAHMYGVHDSILLLSFGSTLQRTVWHSFAMGDQREPRNLGLLIDLDSHKPVTVETTYVSVVLLCAARTIPPADDGCRLFLPRCRLAKHCLTPFNHPLMGDMVRAPCRKIDFMGVRHG